MKHKKTLRRGLSILLSLLLCLTLVPATALAEETETSVEINETNFPDATFRAYVSENFDTDKNGTLSAEEIAAVTEIKCWEKGITDLTGIKYFTELTKLLCYDNLLTELNVESNTALTFLNCANNKLTELNLSNNTALATLFCEENQLTVLDVQYSATYQCELLDS